MYRQPHFNTWPLIRTLGLLMNDHFDIRHRDSELINHEVISLYRRFMIIVKAIMKTVSVCFFLSTLIYGCNEKVVRKISDDIINISLPSINEPLHIADFSSVIFLLPWRPENWDIIFDQGIRFDIPELSASCVIVNLYAGHGFSMRGFYRNMSVLLGIEDGFPGSERSRRNIRREFYGDGEIYYFEEEHKRGFIIDIRTHRVDIMCFPKLGEGGLNCSINFNEKANIKSSISIAKIMAASINFRNDGKVLEKRELLRIISEMNSQ